MRYVDESGRPKLWAKVVLTAAAAAFLAARVLQLLGP